MEDEESGDSACNSSDGGGSRSWVQSPSYEPTQLLYSKEGPFSALFLSLHSYILHGM
jgi:hypothetical protein